MAFKSLKCPNCSAQIDTIDENTKRAFCPYCDAVIEDVQEQQKDFEITIKEPVRVEGLETQNQLFDRIQGFVKLGDRAKVEYLLKEYTDKYPLDFRGWKQLYLFRKKALGTYDGVYEVDVKEGLNYLRNCIKTAQNNEDIAFLNKEKLDLENLKNDLDNQLNNLERQRGEFEIQRDQASQSLDEKKKIQECANSNELDADRKEKEARAHDGSGAGMVLSIVFAIMGAWVIGGAAGLGWGFVAFLACGAIGLVVPVAISADNHNNAVKSKESAQKKAEQASEKMQEARNNLNKVTTELNNTESCINQTKAQVREIDRALKMLSHETEEREEAIYDYGFSVVLESFGDNKIGVIAAYRNITGASLKEAVKAVESEKSIVKSGVSKEEATRIISELKAAGGRAFLQ